MSDRKWFSISEIAARKVPGIFEDMDGTRWEIIADERDGVFVGRRAPSPHREDVGALRNAFVVGLTRDADTAPVDARNLRNAAGIVLRAAITRLDTLLAALRGTGQ